MRVLVRVFNHHGYPILSVIILATLAIVLASNGIAALDLIILVALIAVALGVWRLLVSSQTEGMDSVQLVRQAIQNGQRPTILQFYSAYCAGCIAMKPVVDQLEAEAGDRIQVIRLNIDSEPGKTLMQEHGVMFTPTFVYFDARGNKVRESIGVLDRYRILYDLENT